MFLTRLYSKTFKSKALQLFNDILAKIKEEGLQKLLFTVTLITHLQLKKVILATEKDLCKVQAMCTML